MAKDSAKFVAPAGVALALAYKHGTFGKIRKSITETFSSDNVRSDSAPIDIHQADTIHGLPPGNIEFDPEIYQYYPDTCAIQSQYLILKQFGIETSQEELIEIAKENGWYAEGYGTPLEMVGKLLEHFGIPFHGTVNNNIFNIASELAQGHQLIVGVDANELWDPIGSMGVDEFYGEQANHALTVVGLDTSDPANIMVIVTDPGTGNRQFAYPADQFIDAWQDSDCFMVATDQAPVCPDGSPFLPVEYFGSIPSADVHRLAQADFSVADPSTWHTFVHDLISQNFDLDNLPAYAARLFGNDSSDDFDSINSDDL